MKDIFECIRWRSKEPSPWLDKLAVVFNAMDAGYDEAAGLYGFVCRGCEDNCCRTRFYHHTLLETMAVYRGYVSLPVEKRERVYARAVAYCRQHAAADGAGTRVKPWCPLNDEGRCLVYDLRPMICRLHGIPHVLHLPGGKTVQGPGCDDFMALNTIEKQAPLDRTPFYREMSGIEKAFRADLNITVKFKQTIAEMILSFHSEDAAEGPKKPKGDTP